MATETSEELRKHEWEKARHVVGMACVSLALVWFARVVGPLLPDEWAWALLLAEIVGCGSVWLIVPFAVATVGGLFPWWKDDHFLQWPRFWWGMDKWLRTMIVGFGGAGFLWFVQMFPVTEWPNAEAWRGVFLQAMWASLVWGVIGVARLCGEPGKAPRASGDLARSD